MPVWFMTLQENVQTNKHIIADGPFILYPQYKLRARFADSSNNCCVKNLTSPRWLICSRVAFITHPTRPGQSKSET